jgi:hypothetical protein
MGANTPSADCLYVYGIVDAVTDALLPVRGPGGATLQQTAVGPLAAVHCWIDPSELDDLEADIAEGSRLAALVRHHDEVVRALAAIGPVLPVRLGTLLPDQAALTELLGAGDAGIGTALDRVRDCGEWELRVNMSGAVADESADEQPEAVGVGAGTNYLMRRQNERRRQTQLRETLDAKVAALDAELAQLATAATGAGMSYAGSGARRAYLVHESARNAVVAVAAQGIAELESAGCDAALRGPLPPYSFADVRLEAHADA